MTTTHPITILRSGVTADGRLELQLVYGNDRGSSIWFQLSHQQARKLYRELEALLEESAQQPLFVPLVKAAAE